MSTKILLIRHGETAWNRSQIFRGTYDIPLNENGRKQARLAAESLKDAQIHAAYTSPLSRARESADLVTETHGIAPVIHEGLIDMDYGQWTGKEDSEVAKRWPQEHTKWTTHPHTARPPGGATLEDVFQNSFSAMEELAQKHDGQTIALFAHRVVNKVLILGALSLGLDRFPYIIQGNCCINELERIQGGYLIHCINDVSHIKKAGTDLLEADF